MLINDGRSLFGAAALVITGAVLAIIAYPYYQFGEIGEPVKRGRWVWEILMNLQVLCLAFMWHCYTDKIKKSDGKRAFLMKVRLLFSLIAVLLPFFVVMTSVMAGWFSERPPAIEMMRYTYLFSVVGLVCILIPRVALWILKIETRRRAKATGLSRKVDFLHMSPGLLALCLALAALMLGRYDVVIWLPLLLYIQAAVPYFVSGLQHSVKPT